MKTLLVLAMLAVVSAPVSALGTAASEGLSLKACPSAVLPKPLEKAGLKLGMSFDELSRKRKNIKLNKTESFREIYIEENFSKEIKSLVYYVTGDSERDKRVYEFIIVMKEDSSPEELAKKTWGDANLGTEGGAEWRFSIEQTGLEGTMAAWVFQNKLVIAYAMPGSEWEPGFEQE